MMATSHLFSFFFIIIVVFFFCAYIHIDLSDKYTKNITIGSNKASSSSEFCMIDFRSSMANIDNHPPILPFLLLFLINLPNRHRFVEKENISIIFEYLLSSLNFLRIVCNMFDDRSLMFIFNSMIISLGNKEKRKPSNHRTLDVLKTI